MAQIKEQIKTPETERNKTEISNLSDVEFKTLIMRMLKELSEDLNSIKKIHSDKKKESKKMRLVLASGTTSSVTTFAS